MNEELLAREREYSRKLREYAAQIANRYEEAQRREAALRAELAAAAQREKQTVGACAKAQTDLDLSRGELARYRNAWSEILQREREAKAILEDCSILRQKFDELESANRSVVQVHELECRRLSQASQAAEECYKQEIHSLVGRVQIAETKFADAAKVIQQIDEERAKRDQELKAREEKLRWEFQNVLLEERERLCRKFDEETDAASRAHQEEMETAAHGHKADLDRATADGARTAEELKREASEERARALSERDAEAAKQAQALEADLGRARTRSAESAARAESLTAEIAGLKSGLERSRAEIAALVDERTNQAQRISMQRKECDELQGELKDQRELLEREKEAARNVRVQLAAAGFEVTAKSAEIDKSQKALFKRAAELETALREIADLKLDLEETRNDVATSRNSESVVRAEADRLRSELVSSNTTHRNQAEAARSKETALASEIGVLVSQRAEARAEIDRLREQLAADVSSRDRRIVALRGECGLAYRLLEQEKSRLADVIENVRAQLERFDSGVTLDPELLQTLLDEAQVRNVPSELSH